MALCASQVVVLATPPSADNGWISCDCGSVANPFFLSHGKEGSIIYCLLVTSKDKKVQVVSGVCMRKI